MGGSKIDPMDSTEEMSCQELVEVVTDYLENTLARADRERFDAHLAECPGCADYVRQMRLTLELAGKIEEDALPPDARTTLLEAFRGWRKE